MNIFIQSIAKSVFVTLCLLSASNVYADCSSAESDIATLEQEKRDNDDRIAKGVFSVLPMGLALNAVNSSGKSKEEKMDAKEYKAKINSRIAEIKAECDIK